MRPKRIIFHMSIVVSLTLLIGCSATEKLDGSREDENADARSLSLDIDSSSVSSSLLSTPSHVTSELFGVMSVDAVVETPTAVDSVSEFTARRIDWTPEKVVPLFFKDSYPEIRETTNANNPWYSCVSDEGTLNMGTGTLVYASSAFRPQIYDIALLFCQNPATMREVFAKEQLSSLNAEDAINDVRRLTEALGIENYGEASAYALSPSRLNELAEQNRAGTPLEDLFTLTEDDYSHFFTVDDEVCIVQLGINVDGAPVTKSSYSDGKSDRYYLGSSIEAWITKAGIVRVSISEGLDTFSVCNSSETIVPLDEALVSAAEKYFDVISNAPLSIKEIRFEYVPRSQDDSFNTVSYVPAWYLSPGLIEEQYATSIRVNALTGEVF